MKGHIFHFVFMSSGLVLSAPSSSSSSPEIIVDIRDKTPQEKLSVLTCTGLLNRNEENFNGVYTLMDQNDLDWLDSIYGITDPANMPISEFMTYCVAEQPRYVTYDYHAQQEIIPNLITIAAVENALLLEDGQFDVTNADMVMNASLELQGMDPLEASEFVYDHYINETSTLSWMNPGYDNGANASDPPLTKDPTLGLTDFIVKEKLFNQFLNNACIKASDQYSFMSKLEVDNPWPRPIPVYGYNNGWPIAGDIFEAETNCNEAHNMM